MDFLVCNFFSGVSVHSRCNETATLYADGSRIFDCGNSFTRNIIPKTTRVVAVKGHNDGGRAFIVAGFSNGFKTDTEKWKCTDQLYPDWKTAGYNDSLWSPASDQNRTEFDADFVADELVIWTDSVSENSDVYCRGYIGE